MKPNPQTTIQLHGRVEGGRIEGTALLVPRTKSTSSGRPTAHRPRAIRPRRFYVSEPKSFIITSPAPLLPRCV